MVQRTRMIADRTLIIIHISIPWRIYICPPP